MAMRFESTQVISFVNQKGGCGKTSSSVSVAAAFASLGHSVCLIDTDSQCNATDPFNVNPDDAKEKVYTVADIYLSKMYAADVEISFGGRFDGLLTLIPGHKGLKTVPARLESEKLELLSAEDKSVLDVDDITSEQRFRLKESLKSLRGKKDLVIIDTPPDLGFEMTTALIASDWFVIPLFPSGYDLKGLEALIGTVDKVKARYNPKLRLAGVLLGNFDKTAKLDRDIHNHLLKQFGDGIVFQTTIARSVKHREATIHRKTIFEHAPNDQASLQYAELVREMLNRGSKIPDGISSTRKPLPDDSALEKIKDADLENIPLTENESEAPSAEVANG